MKKQYKILYLFAIALLLFLSLKGCVSCAKWLRNGFHSEPRIIKQITSSGKYIIYSYTKFGGAFTSDINGIKLFKINEKFKEGKGIDLDGNIFEWISDDTLLVYNISLKSEEISQPKDTFPIKTTFKTVGDFTLKTDYYISNSFMRVNIRNFDFVSTTKDSIFIRTVKEKEIDIINNAKLYGKVAFYNGEDGIFKFPLGSVRITLKSDSIINISASKIKKGMDFELLNPDSTYTTGLPRISIVSFDFVPTKKISTEGLNERKIWWEIIK